MNAPASTAEPAGSVRPRRARRARPAGAAGAALRLLAQHAQLGLLGLLGHVLLGHVLRVRPPRCAAPPRGRTPGTARCGPRSPSRSRPPPARRSCRSRGCSSTRRPRSAARSPRLAAEAWPFTRRISIGLVDVAVGLLQRGLAVHHPRAGALAQGLYVLCRDRRRSSGLLVGIEGAALARAPAGGLRVPLGVAGSSGEKPASSASRRARSSASRRSCSSASRARALLRLAALLLLALAARGLLLGAEARRALGRHVGDRLDDQLARADRVVVARDHVSRPGPGRSWCPPGR